MHHKFILHPIRSCEIGEGFPVKNLAIRYTRQMFLSVYHLETNTGLRAIL